MTQPLIKFGGWKRVGSCGVLDCRSSRRKEAPKFRLCAEPGSIGASLRRLVPLDGVV
jgi:hypothetical protein